ncbi:MAG: hypothetical protein K6E53_12090 [Lachnospiraceae bacterium]|nr:hypothetical protein [Lachnospiraceae bacterium]
MDYNNGNEGNEHGIPEHGMNQNSGMPARGMNQGLGMPAQGMMQGQIPPQFRGQQGPGPQGYGMNSGRPGGMPGQGYPMQGMPGPDPRQQGYNMQGRPPQGTPGRNMYQGQRMPGQISPQYGAGRNPRMQIDNINEGRQGQPQRMPGRVPQGRTPQDEDMQLRKSPVSRSGLRNNDRPAEERDDRTSERRGSRLFNNNDEGAARKTGSGLSFEMSPGLMEGVSGASPYIFGGILVICLLIAVIAYGTSHKGKGKIYVIPKEMVTYNGLFKDVYDNAVSGKLSKGGGSAGGAMYDEDGSEIPPAPTGFGEMQGSDASNDTASGENSNGSSSETASSAGSGASGGSTSGAAMVLDSGEGVDGYTQAESYNELLTQLEKAIASGDTAFVGSKVGYEDEDGSIKGFPQSVVDHFVTYMSLNSDKRTALMTELSNDKYSAQEGSVFLVKFPYIKFVVNMGYDETTISLSGFTDQVVNAGQSADIAPLLPCMYTLTISNAAWSEPVTRDIEANVNETTISINIKP